MLQNAKRKLYKFLLWLTGVDYFYINAITLGFMSVAFLISFLLPMPKRSMFFKGEKAAGSQKEEWLRSYAAPVMDASAAGPEEEKMERDGSAAWFSKNNLIAAGHLLWESLRESYSSRYVLDVSCFIHRGHTENKYAYCNLLQLG